MNWKGKDYHLYLDSDEVTVYSHTSIHLALKLLERLEIPYYN
jgi:uncharacterized protein YacL (UPF0231 family)